MSAIPLLNKIPASQQDGARVFQRPQSISMSKMALCSWVHSLKGLNNLAEILWNSARGTGRVGKVLA